MFEKYCNFIISSPAVCRNPPRVNHHSVPTIIRAKCPTATALSFAATTTC